MKYQKELKRLFNNGNLSEEDVAEIISFMNKESKLKSVINLEKIKYRKDNSRPYIYINRIQYSAASYEELVDILYSLYFDNKPVSIKDLYTEWLIWRRDYSNVSLKTIKENRYLYDAYFKETALVEVPLSQLKPMDFLNHFRKMTKDGTMTRKRFNDAKSVLNGIITYAIEKEIIDHNILKDLNYRQLNFKAESGTKETYTLEEREHILSYLENDTNMYSLAIQFDFFVIMRIGELKALRWTDIEGDYIKIHSQELEEQNMNDDLTFSPRIHINVNYTKGHTAEGMRYMPLIDGAKKILSKVREINPDGEFIFMQNGRQLTTSTFNKHLKKICIDLGIKPKSSHKIRFAVASALYKNGFPATKLQKLLVHTTLAMTLHYLLDITSDEESYEQMSHLLS